MAHVPERISYGSSPVEYGELRLPAGDGPHPVAVLIHGGFWKEMWTLDLMDGLAVDLAANGWASWNIEYHRVGGGGGWPTTLEDVGQAIDFLRKLADEHNLDLSNIAAIGHSAGGHLALWSAARPQLYDEEPVKENVLKPHRVVGLAAVADLAVAHEMGLGSGAVEELMRRDPEGGPERYRSASPAELVPLGVDQLLVHGTDDESVPVDVARGYAAKAAAAGDTVTLHEVAGGDHFVVIDPSSAAWRAVVKWLG
ncbi:MAG: alpha/beta hydrolase [Acidimicrobiia bacterium]|nr:alpha/beta hydrolase [Acidimicrobiia bacterium]